MDKHFWHIVWGVFFGVVVATGILIGQALVIAFGVMGLLAGGISWAWNKLSLEQLSYERELNLDRVFKGEEVSLKVALVNRKVVPLTWVRVEDDIPVALKVVEGDIDANLNENQQSLNHSTSISWYERVSWDYRLLCTQRGIYELGPVRIESGDPFGFLRSVRWEGVKGRVLVYPRVVPLEELGIPSVRPLGEVRGGMKVFHDPSRPSGLRDYQLGDPLKIVDWKATARAQSMQVRTFEPSSSTTIILVVAVDTTTPHWAAYEPEVLERVITASASMAAYAAEHEYSIGLLSNDMPIEAGRPLNIAPGRGPDQLSLILGALAIVRAYALAPMSTQLAEHARRFPLGSTIVVSTAYVPPEFVAALRELKDRGHKIVVLYAGEDHCPEIAEGVLVYELREKLDALEEAA